ncbi:MAG TPA: phosphatidylserine decarboxylase, partial [Chlamydiales bacterium]|nr:phosphatidylserine decarboxylase [Chlamydiales bacterium]
MEIRYIHRKTNTVEVEKIYGHRALSLFYGDSWTSRLFSFLFTPLLSRIPIFSKIYGYFQKRPKSAKKIDPFINTYGIDRSEFANTNFNSFNDFFTRKLKKEVRPIVQDPRRAVLPADGRYLVFPSLQQEDLFYVKGRPFDLVTFLQNGAYARRYHEGSMVIARLCPTDYHRFHFVADGIPARSQPIDGDYHSVSPIALRKNFS